MQTEKQNSTRTATPTPAADRTAREGAFTTRFLERARSREDSADLAASPLARQAHAAGPWEIEPISTGSGVCHAVSRRAEPVREGGSACLVFRQRQDALLGAATLAAVASPSHLALNQSSNRRPGRLGHPIHDGARHLGHLAPSLVAAGEEFLAYYHATRCLAANPDAVSLFLEALDGETLSLLGRAAMRRMG